MGRTLSRQGFCAPRFAALCSVPSSNQPDEGKVMAKATLCSGGFVGGVGWGGGGDRGARLDGALT